MQLSAQELDAVSLAKLGDEARMLLCAGDIDTLATRFGYALAYDRHPADAIREELASSLAEAGASRLIATGWQPPRVGYFKQNDTGLFALVESLVPTENGASILVEVIVAGSGTNAHATLEQVSAAV
ncbi:hypothetical protein ACFPOE_13585 [Caenimonas terrae]|uniref:Uncharacterized protein n=1 Tax=Caenimonas terrae TaxID=696074 RepID=A0ABW0NF88_9BURK